MITIETKNGRERMSVEVFSRWGCLLEAFEFIQKRAEELNLDVDAFIKPLAIEKYVEERFPSILHDVTVENQMGLLN